MSIINTLLNHPLLVEKPLVFIDIGASGGTSKAWKKIASKAICIAFDADNRELKFEQKESAFFKKLFIINAIVTDKEDSELEFNLTRSPFCSSSLIPNIEELQEYKYVDSFDVIEKVKLKSINLTKALAQLNIDYIDWFKTDSQGTDLRIFASVPQAIQNAIMVAEFEPGIINAYKNEDMLHDVIKYMGNNNRYFCESCDIKGTPRIKTEYLNKLSSGKIMNKLFKVSLPQDASWAEIRYLAKHNKINNTRSKIVAFIFSYTLGQFGNALAIVSSLENELEASLIKQMKQAVNTKAKLSVFNINWLKLIAQKLS